MEENEIKSEIPIFDNPRVFRTKKDFQQNYKVTLNRKKISDEQKKLLTIDDTIRKNKGNLMVLTDEDPDGIRYCFISRHIV